MKHVTLQKLEAYWSRHYKGLWVQSVYPGMIVILRGGQCVDSVDVTPQEAQFLGAALGAASSLQAIPCFIVALHQGYWPARGRNTAALPPHLRELLARAGKAAVG